MMQEQIIRTDYAEVMQKSYVDYAMSVIISRALRISGTLKARSAPYAI